MLGVHGRGGITSLLILIGGAGLRSGAQEPIDDLPTILAESDANIAAIQSGSAVCNITTIKFLDGAPQPPREWTVPILFSGSVARWEVGDQRYLLESSLVYTITGWDNPEYPPPRKKALVDHLSKAGASPWRYHPRAIGHAVDLDWAERLPLFLRGRVDRVKAEQREKLLITRDGSLTRLEIRVIPERVRPIDKDVRSIYWLDPTKAYSVVRQEDWSHAEQPRRIIETNYQKVADAFVAERSKRFEGYFLSGKFVKDAETETILRDVSLAEPDPKELTIEGTGLPVGGYVIDRFAGREYLYGIPAVTDEEIEEEVNRLRAEHDDAGRAAERRRTVFWISSVCAGLLATLAIAVAFRVLQSKRLAREGR